MGYTSLLRYVYVITRSTIAMQSSRRREPHGNEDGNPKRRTLQPPTLNPSAVVVFSRCHREVRGGVSHLWPDGAPEDDVPSSSTRRVVKMTEAGVHPTVRALRRGVRGRHLSAHVDVARRGGWWARRRASRTSRCRVDGSMLISSVSRGVRSGLNNDSSFLELN